MDASWVGDGADGGFGFRTNCLFYAQVSWMEAENAASCGDFSEHLLALVLLKGCLDRKVAMDRRNGELSENPM